MQTFTFTYQGKDVTVEIDYANGHKFYYLINGNKQIFTIKGFLISFNAKSMQVFWSEDLLDSGNEILKSATKEYVNTSLARYDGLYNVVVLAEKAGDYYAKQCMNGVMSRVLGCYCFLPDGTFQAPA